MQQFKRRPAPSAGPQKFQRRVLAIAAVLVLLYTVFAFVQYWRAKRELAAAGREGARLAQENKEIKEDIERLRNDPNYLEEVARHKHGLLRKDEMVFQFKKKGGDKEEVHEEPRGK